MSNLGVSRRNVIKAAAWSIPVLSMAVASPAYAASETDKSSSGAGDAILMFDTIPAAYITGSWDSSAGANIITSFRTQLQVQNVWQQSQTVVQPLTIIVTYPLSHVADQDPVSYSGSLAYLNRSVSGQYVTYTFVYSTPVTSGGSTTHLDVVLNPQKGMRTSSQMSFSCVVTAPQTHSPLSQAGVSNTW